MNKEICALKLVDEIILYYDARSKKHQINRPLIFTPPQKKENCDKKFTWTLFTCVLNRI